MNKKKERLIFVGIMGIIAICFRLPYLPQKEKVAKQTDFFFSIPELDLTIGTSKQPNGKFYIVFNPTDTIITISDSIDYIETSLKDINTNIIFDPRNKEEIYVLDIRQINNINPVKFNIWRLITNIQYDTLFFEKRIMTQPPIMKSPFIHLSIIPSGYAITLHYSATHQVRIKEGDLYGGWQYE